MKKSIILLGIIFFSLNPVWGQQQAKQNTGQKAEEKIQPSAIPVSEILTRADNLHIQLNHLKENLSSMRLLDNIEKELPAFTDSMSILLSDTAYSVLKDYSVRTLQNVLQDWVFFGKKLEEREKELRNKLAAAEEKALSSSTAVQAAK